MKFNSLKILFVSVFCIFISTEMLYAYNTISKETSDYLDKFMDFRMNLSLTETDEEAVGLIEDFMVDNYLPIKENLTEEENLILINFYYTERYNYMQYDKVPGWALATEKELLDQISVNKAFFEEHKNESLNGWTLVTAANVIGCYMSFHPVSTALKYGLEQKDMYKTAWEQEKDFFMGASHYAQWLFFAPGFYGGSKKLSEKLFLDSIELAKRDSEKYYANIYMSQFYYTQGKKDKAKLYLDTADTYLPGGRYVAFIRDLNSKNISTFEYKKE